MSDAVLRVGLKSCVKLQFVEENVVAKVNSCRSGVAKTYGGGQKLQKSLVYFSHFATFALFY